MIMKGDQVRIWKEAVI